MRRRALLLFTLIFLFVLCYPFLDALLIDFLEESDSLVTVARIVDGDTVVTTDGVTLRLLGINTPERGDRYYSEARDFLFGHLINRTVRQEGHERDLYGRELVFLWDDDVLLNELLVREGYATPYFPTSSKEYSSRILSAFQTCLEEERGVCAPSKDRCAKCIRITSVDLSTEHVFLKNHCSFTCDLTEWTLKDEGRKRFSFPEVNVPGGKGLDIVVTKENISSTPTTLYWGRKDYVWTRTGDSAFLLDREEYLVDYLPVV